MITPGGNIIQWSNFVSKSLLIMATVFVRENIGVVTRVVARDLAARIARFAIHPLIFSIPSGRTLGNKWPTCSQTYIHRIRRRTVRGTNGCGHCSKQKRD
jgi:hypothetical protein